LHYGCAGLEGARLLHHYPLHQCRPDAERLQHARAALVEAQDSFFFSQLIGIEAEVQKLRSPIRVGIPQALDVDATREAAFNRCLDELWRKKRERERQIDLPFGALFAPCQLGGVA
jgi:hypothetical protein